MTGKNKKGFLKCYLLNYLPSMLKIKTLEYIPVSVAQLDAHPTGDQEDAGSIPAGSATFFRGDLIKK